MQFGSRCTELLEPMTKREAAVASDRRFEIPLPAFGDAGPPCSVTAATKLRGFIFNRAAVWFGLWRGDRFARQ